MYNYQILMYFQIKLILKIETIITNKTVIIVGFFF